MGRYRELEKQMSEARYAARAAETHFRDYICGVVEKLYDVHVDYSELDVVYFTEEEAFVSFHEDFFGHEQYTCRFPRWILEAECSLKAAEEYLKIRDHVELERTLKATAEETAQIEQQIATLARRLEELQK